MGVIDLDARVKKLEQDAGGGAVIDQLEAAVTALEETVNGDGDTDLGLVGDVAALQTYVEALSDYSETETVVGTWTDGKPVYQKTIISEITSTATSGKLEIAHNISNMETVVAMYGIINNKTTIPYGESFPSKDTSMGRVSVKSTVIEVAISGAWTGYIFNITLRYTKSTDSAPTA